MCSRLSRCTAATCLSKRITAAEIGSYGALRSEALILLILLLASPAAASQIRAPAQTRARTPTARLFPDWSLQASERTKRQTGSRELVYLVRA